MCIIWLIQCAMRVHGVDKWVVGKFIRNIRLVSSLLGNGFLSLRADSLLEPETFVCQKVATA